MVLPPTKPMPLPGVMKKKSELSAPALSLTVSVVF